MPPQSILARLSRTWPSSSRSVADRLDIVSIVIENESAVVVRVIVRAKARGPIVLAARGDGGSVECIYGWPIFRSEGNVQRPFHLPLAADPKIRLTAAAESSGWLSGLLSGRLHDQGVAERRQRALIKSLGADIVRNRKTQVIDHDALRQHEYNSGTQELSLRDQRRRTSGTTRCVSSSVKGSVSCSIPIGDGKIFDRGGMHGLTMLGPTASRMDASPSRTALHSVNIFVKGEIAGLVVVEYPGDRPSPETASGMTSRDHQKPFWPGASAAPGLGQTGLSFNRQTNVVDSQHPAIFGR